LLHASQPGADGAVRGAEPDVEERAQPQIAPTGACGGIGRRKTIHCLRFTHPEVHRPFHF
jgi:hypothetical protein